MPEVYPPDDPINTFTPNNQPPRNMNIGVLPVDGEGMMMGDVFTTLHLAVPKDEKLRKEIEQLGINRNVKKNQELNKLTKKDIMRPYNLRWCKISKDLKSSYPMCRLIMLAFMSDLRFLAINAQPHYLGYNYGKTDHVMMTSLDHTMYFYTSDFEIEDSWLLYETESLRYANGRGVTHGRFFDTKGKMIASTLQEALVILLYTPKSGTNGSQVPDKETLASTTLTFSKPPPMLYVEKSGVEHASSSAVSLVSTKL
ncbi:Acyl-CoA thioesterase 2 [Zancudomyces culisetae]|uniref:Acyl-CoA thioesterase 2 n=1 Tax=Zancudomyces culisetae TaxID=1213189 RepID=A0A1R1PIM3_ZANCU|nr:Acyl-CoA thioesterase 2 [Zancudomyces culisetae]OMH85654.1 Acyl-CoA thioesterase 2 [Zancudomyces culisetae]|eukprot:OMH80807.1 Acyl-CoA thioesterase 2 [Zancudomyces culisetae]